MTKLNAERTARTQSAILQKSYVVVELPSGEHVSIPLPLTFVSTWRPDGDGHSKRVEHLGQVRE